jgi:Predicted membrane protein (DUF2254)
VEPLVRSEKLCARGTLDCAPLLALVVEQVVIRIAASVDAQAAWVPWVGASAEGILGEMDTVITLTISFMVFTFGSLLVAIQVAGGQLTPRIFSTTQSGPGLTVPSV